MEKMILAIIMTCCCIGLVTAQEQSGGANKPLRESGKESPAYNDPLKSVELTVGQEFAIELDANATTGYKWQLAQALNSSIIELLSTEYRVSKTGLVGAGGKEIWKFRAVDQGKTTIAMRYIRPWEKDVPPVKNVQFRVVIHH